MAESENIVTYESSTRTVLILFFCLIGLIALLIFLYKKLNRVANGEYTVQRMVYKEGGVRDRMRGTALALGTRFGVQLWPKSDSDEDGEGMQDFQDEEGQVEEGESQENDSEGDDQDKDDDDDVEQLGNGKGKGGDTSDDNSDLESSEAEEQARLTDQAEAKRETDEKVRDGEGEARGGAGLLVDLKQFSGSAIWSEEEGGEGKNINMTAL